MSPGRAAHAAADRDRYAVTGSFLVLRTFRACLSGFYVDYAHSSIRIGKRSTFATAGWRVSEMDKDRIVGAAKQAKGAIKEVAGKAIGDAKLVADGKKDKVEGKIQNAVGSAKDALRK